MSFAQRSFHGALPTPQRQRGAQLCTVVRDGHQHPFTLMESKPSPNQR